MKTQPNSVIDLLAGKHRFHQKTYLKLWGHADIQHALDVGRERFGHALCLCRKEPLKLQIRLRHGRFHLAVWPTEADKHDSECIFFRDEFIQTPSRLPGQTDAPPDKPEQPNADPAKRFDLRMAYLADVDTTTRSAKIDQGKPPQMLGSNSPVVSIKKLMMLLWESADLCRWHPTWTRDWGRVRWQLARLAGEVSVNQIPLNQLLFVPRPYRESIKNELNDEWESFVRSLPVVGQRSTPPRLIICAVRRYSPSFNGHPAVVHLRHLRYPIGISEHCDKFLKADCYSSLKLINSPISSQTIKPSSIHDSALFPEVIGIFLVDGTTRGGVFAKAAWLMNVHPTSFIPANNLNSVLLVDQLIGKGYSFNRLLSDVPPMSRRMPDWIVRHVLDPNGVSVSRVALEIIERGCSNEYIQARQNLAQALSEKGIPTWTWMPLGRWHDRSAPILPPTERVEDALANEQIKHILNSPDVDYRYGISRKQRFTFIHHKP